MSSMKDQLIRLGSTTPALRPHIRPILAAMTTTSNKAEAENNVRELWSYIQKHLKNYGWYSVMDRKGLLVHGRSGYVEHLLVELTVTDSKYAFVVSEDGRSLQAISFSHNANHAEIAIALQKIIGRYDK